LYRLRLKSAKTSPSAKLESVHTTILLALERKFLEAQKTNSIQINCKLDVLSMIEERTYLLKYASVYCYFNAF
jgi:hypothetical protein